MGAREQLSVSYFSILNFAVLHFSVKDLATDKSQIELNSPPREGELPERGCVEITRVNPLKDTQSLPTLFVYTRAAMIFI